MSTKSHNIFTSFLELLGVKHTREFSDRYFNEHPNKYNLLGISKMLSDYGVENAGTKIQDKEKDLFNIEVPFIAHFGSEFVVVYKIDSDQVSYIWNGKKLTIPVNEFIQAWTGIILLAETTPNSIEPDYKIHRKKELFDIIQKLTVALAGILIFGITYLNRSLFANLGITLLLVINLIGVYIGYLLILKQLNIHSQYADKICSLFSQSDCNNVLESKAARLWDVFGWSEIGLGYFVANVCLLLFSPDTVSLLAIINIFTLPYSFWSVWYQKVKAKQWCPLCLIVQVLLWGIFVLNCLSGYIQLPEFNSSGLTNLLFVGCIYVGCVLVFNLVVPQLGKGGEIEQVTQEINAIKTNEDVFKVLLLQQPYYEANEWDSQIFFGNPGAHLKVTILTNPYCNPCARMHTRMEKILKETNSDICIQYIFSSFKPDLDFANKYLIAVYLETDKNTVMQIYRDWFERGKPLKEEFFKDFQLNMNNPAIEAEFQKHKAWKEKTKLSATPTVLVNGYQLPANYKIEDLRYFTKLEIDVNQSLPR